jgi:hypothetical protein
MMSMNLVFHLFSAVLAFVLAWYVMRLRAMQKFSQQLITGAGAGDGRVFVDSPYRFLKRFTAMMGMTFDSDARAEADTGLVKIDGSALLRICLEYGVFSIRIEGNDQDRQLIRLSARKVPGSSSSAGAGIAAAFNGKVRAEFTS